VQSLPGVSVRFGFLGKPNSSAVDVVISEMTKQIFKNAFIALLMLKIR
jgi:hypothetical protein